MLKSRHIVIIGGVVLLLFLGGLIQLFQLRFDAGDIYPPYSSLRTDPLGAKVLYEGLRRLPGLTVVRYFESDAKLHGNEDRVLLLFGLPSSAMESMTSADYYTLRTFMYEGGRVVISLLPNTETGNFRKSKSSTPHSSTNSDEIVAPVISFVASNGLALKTDPLARDEHDVVHPVLAVAGAEFPMLPEVMAWHSANYFADLDKSWRIVYRRKDNPVIIERAYGSGSLVLATDSYFVSNEALRNDRHAELLAWLLGNRREILFDETHFGIEAQLGVAVLMRHYHLEGAIAVLLLLAGLYIWKNSVSLVPPVPDESAGDGAQVAGKETSAGFASLLRRSVPPGEIISTSFAEWKAACGRDPRASNRLTEIQAVIDEQEKLAPGSRRPVETYQAIRRILVERHL